MPPREDHRFENIAIAVLAIFVLFTVVYSLVTRTPPGSQEQADFEEAMPRGYKSVLAAIIRKSGYECDSVCTATSVGSSRVRVSCSVAARKTTCERAVEFVFTIAPTPESTR